MIRVHQLVKRIEMKVTLKLMIALQMKIIPKLNHLSGGLLHSYWAFKQLMSYNTMLFTFLHVLFTTLRTVCLPFYTGSLHTSPGLTIFHMEIAKSR